jgi:predicted ATPase/class 3 adenylate cyclase
MTVMAELKCQNCGFNNPKGMKFCGNCGKPLIEQEKKGERKIISILYVDIAGFTMISETMDPEKVQEMLNTIFENISYSITKFGGTVHKFIGDEVMALFGAPIAYENHAERAGWAALEILKSITDITEMINLSINLHIALHSGEVVLGKVGSEEVHDYTVIGDTVNVAARLEKIAPTNEILVSKEFFERTKHAFKFERFGDTDIKGKRKPITCYLLRDTRLSRDKIRGIRELETPLLGRDKEMSFLVDNVNEVNQNKSLKILIIKGQPGIGKTRLFQEFRDTLDREKYSLFETRSLPFGQEELHPFKQLIRNITEITTDMSVEESTESAIKSFKNLFGSRDIGVLDLMDIILDFTSIKEVNIEPKRKQQIMYYMIENLLKNLSERKPLIIGFEDFHWADSSSLLLLRHLIDFLRDQPILFILISRPLLRDDPVADFFSLYRNRDFSSLLELNPLSKETSLKLITTLLSIDKIPSEVKEQIVQRGEGNPLFIEEVLKVLMDQKVLYKEGDNWLAQEDIVVQNIPHSINEIVMGRVDLLEDIEKKVLQYASVIGRIFWDKPIREAFKQSTISELSSLSNKGFVQQRVESIFEDAKEYIFNHILIQESIYSSILKRVRKNIHGEFGLWLEENYANMIPIISNLLAFHFEKGEIWEKAGKYYLESGKESSKNYSNEEAISHLKKSLEIFEGHKSDTDYSFEIHKELGKVLSRIGKNEEAENHLTEALKGSSDNFEKFESEHLLANLYQKMSLYEKAMEKLESAKSHLGEKNSEELIDIIFDEAWLHYLKGNIKEGIALLDEFEKIFAKVKNRIPERKRDELYAESYNRRATFLDYSGDTRGGLDFYKKALNLYKKLNSRSGLSAVYNNLAGIYHTLGECSEAIEMYEKSKEIDEKIGNRLGLAICYNNLAEMYIFLNDFGKAEVFLHKYLDLNERIHNRLGCGFAYLNFGTIKMELKEFEEALDYFNRALSVFKEVKSERMVAATYEMLAWIHFNRKDFSSSKKYIDKINEYLKGTETLDLKASVKRIEGRISAEEGDYTKAETLLKEALSLFEEMSYVVEFIPLYSDFLTLYSLQGNIEGVTDFKEKGKRTIEKVLSGIKEKHLKESFLKSEEIKRFMA